MKEFLTNDVLSHFIISTNTLFQSKNASNTAEAVVNLTKYKDVLQIAFKSKHDEVVTSREKSEKDYNCTLLGYCTIFPRRDRDSISFIERVLLSELKEAYEQLH